MTAISITAETRARSNARGITAMLVAVGALSLMDACLKILSPHYPALQVTTIRALAALPIIVIWVGATTGYRELTRIRFPLHAVRAVLSICMLGLFAFGVRQLPLANAYAIFFVAPLFITTFAAFLLHERVDRRRWLAIAAGFSAVLVVLRPTAAGALSLPGLAVLGTALGYALSAITVRVLGRTDSTQSMVFWLMLMTATGAGLLALPSWRPLQPEHWWAVAGIAVTGSVGQWAITEAFRLGEASVVAPFEYTALAWGTGLDWFLWSAVPAPRTLVGAGIIIASGIYLFRREGVHVEAEHP